MLLCGSFYGLRGQKHSTPEVCPHAFGIDLTGYESRILPWHNVIIICGIMTEYIDRDITSTVREALKEMPVVIITGMRQTGKSTFLRSESGIRERHYLSLDDFAQLVAAREDPDGY